jgi:hypothetical protein
MQPLHKILREFVKNFGIEGGAGLNIIRKKWVNIVGQTIAVHTFPDTIRGKVLTITVDTPQWMHHLSFYKEEISKKLESYNVNGIRFRLGKLPPEIINQNSKEHVELSEEDLRFLENTVKNIKDEELKEKFRVLITHGLTRGNKQD